MLKIPPSLSTQSYLLPLPPSLATHHTICVICVLEDLVIDHLLLSMLKTLL